MSSIPSDAMPKATAAPDDKASGGRVKQVAKKAGSVAAKAGGAAKGAAKKAGGAAGKAASSVAGAAKRNPKKAIAAGVALAAGVAAAAVIAKRRKTTGGGTGTAKASPKKKG